LPAAQLDFYRATVAAYENKTKEALALAQRAEVGFGRLVPDANRLQRGSPAPGCARDFARGGLESLLKDQSPNTTEERAASRV